MAKMRKIVSHTNTEVIGGMGGVNLPSVTLECGHTQFYSMEQLDRNAAGKDTKRLCKECT